jgi:hypothetical protein
MSALEVDMFTEFIVAEWAPKKEAPTNLAAVIWFELNPKALPLLEAEESPFRVMVPLFERTAVELSSNPEPVWSPVSPAS